MLFISIYWILYYKALKFIWPEFIIALHIKIFKLYNWSVLILDYILPIILPFITFFIKWVLPIIVLLVKYLLYVIWWKFLSIPLSIISYLAATGSAFLPIIHNLLPTLDYLLPIFDYLLFHIAPTLLRIIDYIWPIVASILDYLYPIALSWAWYLWDNLFWPILDYFWTMWELRWILIYGTILYMIFMPSYMFIIYNALSVYDICEFYVPDFVLYIVYFLTLVIISYSPLAYPLICLACTLSYASVVWGSVISLRYFYNKLYFIPLWPYAYLLLLSKIDIVYWSRLRWVGLFFSIMSLLYGSYILIYYLWFYQLLLVFFIYLYFFTAYLYIFVVSTLAVLFISSTCLLGLIVLLLSLRNSP